MASKRHLDAIWSELRKTPPFRRYVQIITTATTEDEQNAVIKYVRGLMTEELNALKKGKP